MLICFFLLKKKTGTRGFDLVKILDYLFQLLCDTYYTYIDCASNCTGLLISMRVITQINNSMVYRQNIYRDLYCSFLIQTFIVLYTQLHPLVAVGPIACAIATAEDMQYKLGLPLYKNQNDIICYTSRQSHLSFFSLHLLVTHWGGNMNIGEPISLPWRIASLFVLAHAKSSAVMEGGKFPIK